MTAIPEMPSAEKEKLQAQAQEMSKIPKEKVWRPVFLTPEQTEKTWIVAVFYWTPRRDRRKKFRNRVREKSPETFHPAHKKERAEKYYALRQARMLKSKKKFNS